MQTKIIYLSIISYFIITGNLVLANSSQESLSGFCHSVGVTAELMYTEHLKGVQQSNNIYYTTLKNIDKGSAPPSYVDGTIIPFINISTKYIPSKYLGFLYWQVCFRKGDSNQELIKYLSKEIKRTCLANNLLTEDDIKYCIIDTMK